MAVEVSYLAYHLNEATVEGKVTADTYKTAKNWLVDEENGTLSIFENGGVTAQYNKNEWLRVRLVESEPETS